MTISNHTSNLLLARLAKEQADNRLPSVSVGVIRDGALAWHAGRGRVGDGIPDEDTQYRCGSITKTFVAACIMRQRDEGAFSLNDRLDTVLPGTGVGGVTIAQLLSHSAGLRSETAGPWWERTAGGDFDALVTDTLGAGAFRLEPGRQFHYSNIGFALLGAVLAARRGMPWEEVVRAELLEPLGMRRTTTRPQAPAAPGLAVHPWADVVLPEPEHDAGAMAPAGQLWTTVADLSTWATFIAGDGGDILASSTLEEMREPRVVAESTDEAWTVGHGLGIQVWNQDGQRLYGHGGSMPGFTAFLVAKLDGDAAVGFANATTAMGGTIGTDLLGIIADQEPRLPAEWTPTAPPAGVLDIVGPWYWGPAATVIRYRNGHLELEWYGEGGRGSRFRREADGTWIGLDDYFVGELLTIVRCPDGSVSHIDIGSFTFTREPYDPNAPISGGVDPDGWRPTA